MAYTMSKKKESFRDKLLDWIWPRRTGPKEPQPTGEFAPEGSEEILIKVEEYAWAFVTREEEREKTVDRKLFSLFSISSVASSVMIAGLIGAATITLTETTSAPKYLVVPAIALIWYIALQLLNAIRNTVQGLSARGYLSAKAESVLPNEKDDKATYIARQLGDMMKNTKQNSWVTNQKVSHMNVAHRALTNTFWAGLALLFVAFALAVCQVLR